MRPRIKPFWTVAILIVAASLCPAQVIEAGPHETKVGSGRLLQQDAEAGDSGAQYELGLEAEQKQDYREAFKWFQLAAVSYGGSGTWLPHMAFWVQRRRWGEASTGGEGRVNKGIGSSFGKGS